MPLVTIVFMIVTMSFQLPQTSKVTLVGIPSRALTRTGFSNERRSSIMALWPLLARSLAPIRSASVYFAPRNILLVTMLSVSTNVQSRPRWNTEQRIKKDWIFNWAPLIHNCNCSLRFATARYRTSSFIATSYYLANRIFVERTKREVTLYEWS